MWAIPVSVNVSSKQFRPGELLETVRGALRSSGMEGKDLVLEVTESLLIENPESSQEMLREIKEMGLRISIDDFGTGYSSLSYLKRLPLDELKIDRSFVSGVPTDADDVAIVTAIIAMARGLGVKVIAEGVETRDQLEFLKGQGCDQAQGYLLNEPMPVADYLLLLESGKAGGVGRLALAPV